MKDLFSTEAFKYFEKYYSPIFLFWQKPKKGGVEIFDIIKDAIVSNPTYKIKDSTKTCRFCGKTTPEVTFKEKAHTFPECFGNKLFVSQYNECDDCNDIFSKYEDDFSRYAYPFLLTNAIPGKKGIKAYKSRDRKSTFKKNGDSFEISEEIGHAKILLDEVKKTMTYEFDIQQYTPLNVYKILAKMAIAILPESEISSFKIIRSYLLNNNILGFEKCIKTFYPGFNRFDFYVLGYKKIVDDPSIPSYQFAVMNGNIMFQIPLFSDQDIQQLTGKQILFDMVSIPTPFDFHDIGDKQCMLIDFSDNTLKTGEKQSMTLAYTDRK